MAVETSKGLAIVEVGKRVCWLIESVGLCSCLLLLLMHGAWSEMDCSSSNRMDGSPYSLVHYWSH